METLAIALLAFFAAGWFVLAGADIGTGMLTPWLGRSDPERRLVLTSFAPFFLGNEVWLVATVGVLVGCFPALEGELLSGQFPVLVALLTGWIVRDAGLWSRGRGPGPRWRAGCDAAVTCGSWTVALSWGWLLAALLTGRPYTPATGLTGVLTALAVAALFSAHGLGFATLRLTGLPYERAHAARGTRRAPVAAVRAHGGPDGRPAALGGDLAPARRADGRPHHARSARARPAGRHPPARDRPGMDLAHLPPPGLRAFVPLSGPGFRRASAPPVQDSPGGRGPSGSEPSSASSAAVSFLWWRAFCSRATTASPYRRWPCTRGSSVTSYRFT